MYWFQGLEIKKERKDQMFTVNGFFVHLLGNKFMHKFKLFFLYA